MNNMGVALYEFMTEILPSMFDKNFILIILFGTLFYIFMICILNTDKENNDEKEN